MLACPITCLRSCRTGSIIFGRPGQRALVWNLFVQGIHLQDFPSRKGTSQFTRYILRIIAQSKRDFHQCFIGVSLSYKLFCRSYTSSFCTWSHNLCQVWPRWNMGWHSKSGFSGLLDAGCSYVGFLAEKRCCKVVKASIKTENISKYILILERDAWQSAHKLFSGTIHPNSISTLSTSSSGNFWRVHRTKLPVHAKDFQHTSAGSLFHQAALDFLVCKQKSTWGHTCWICQRYGNIVAKE